LSHQDYKGLSESDAAQRLRQEGPNALPGAQRRGIVAVALELLREPMLMLLLAAVSIYFMLGDMREAAVLSSFVVLISGITLYQEQKTERALAALRELASPRARVVRDGHEHLVAGHEVVRGDVMLLREGDRVPADAMLLACNDLAADESLLTGESVPVRKVPWDGVAQMARPGGDGLPFVYAGSLLTGGQGVAEVMATGARSEIGKIGKALQALPDEPSPLQQETARMVARLALVALALCLAVTLLYGWQRGDWLAALLAAVTLAMTIIPNEYPVVLTVFLALGAWRIARQGVLTRHIPAIETLGAATVLCVDKTGTLTLNRMTLKQLCAGGEFLEVRMEDGAQLPEKFHALIEYGILASESRPADPMEKAFHDLGRHFLLHTEHLHADWELIREYPLTPELLAHSHGWQSGEGRRAVATKGAPEAVADLCHLPPAQWRTVERQAQQMAAQGLRVLGVARARFEGETWPPNPHDLDFEFIGLAGLADPVRPTVQTALQECRSAGLRVVMITGDYAATAQAIAAEIGLDSAGGVITGAELDALSDDGLAVRLRDVNIFARMVPEQKLRLVQALRAAGEVVAMTGDGVNDAPALRAAHIGIAMGGRGTDVAREAAALVLLDDDFASIVHTVRLGRRIYDNIRHAMSYLLAVHVPIAGMSLLPLLFGQPLMLYPAHVVFMEFVIDPACSIVFEAEGEHGNVMRRPPRDPAQQLFGARALLLSLLQGVTVLLAAWLIYVVALDHGGAVDAARAQAFTTLVLGNLGMILTNRSRTRSVFATLRTPNPALWVVVAGALAALALVLYLPGPEALFRFMPLDGGQWLAALGAAVAGVAWLELYKMLRTQRD
jgi:P-type Ca2+ transporter type 2C